MADREFRLRDAGASRGPDPGPGDGRARRAHLPDDLLRLRQRRPRGEPLQPATFGNVYTRLSNPTTAMFEQRMAALVGGRAAGGTASGQAAEMVALLKHLPGGRPHRVVLEALRGTHTMFAVNFPKLGIETTFVVRTTRRTSAAPSAPNDRRSSPRRWQPRDQHGGHRRGRRRRPRGGVPFVVDNTAPPPTSASPCGTARTSWCTRPPSSSAATVTTMGGVVVESGTFPWDNGKFASMTEPSAGIPRRALLRDLRRLRLHEEGAHGDPAPCSARRFSPFNAWLLLRGWRRCRCA